MPGEIINVRVKVGEEVKKNQALATISAMKMETVVAALQNGKVVEVLIKKGMKLGAGDLLFRMEYY